MADRKRTEFDWGDMRFFAALARHGSLSGAARALSVNHATISRRITALEHSLGVALVERRPHGYQLTPAGQQALEAASAMETAALSLPRPNDEVQPSGLLRITATPSLVDAYLIGRLGALRRQQPMLDIEVFSDRRTMSLTRHEADVALRIGRPADSELIGRRLVTIGFAYYADRSWMKKLAAGAQPTFVGFDEGGLHLPEARWLTRKFPKCRLAFRAASQLSQALAAKAGYGVALLPHFIASSINGLSRSPARR